jgi:hypothetical protein
MEIMTADDKKTIRAKEVDCIARHFGDAPVFLLKTFQTDVYANEAQCGNFWASRIGYFRDNKEAGRGDQEESKAPHIAYMVSDCNEKPPLPVNEAEWTYFVPKDKVDRINKHMAECFIVCFY